MMDFIILTAGVLGTIVGFLLIRKYYYKIKLLNWYDTIFLIGLNLLLLSLILFGIGINAIIHQLLKL